MLLRVVSCVYPTRISWSGLPAIIISMSSDQNLHVNDPVLVQSSDGNSDQLEGVVYFVGAVDFAASSNDGDGDGDSSSWVGVRLTGKSVGQGQNDGSVEGKRYFDCPADSGIFVRASSVTKKTLSKLEELRLRRELAASSVTSTSVIGGAKTPPRGEETGGTKSSSPARESTMGGTTTTAKTKLEELRLRREALKQAKQQHESSAAAAAAATAQASSLLGTRTPPRASTSSSPRLIATTASPTTSVPAAPVQGQEIIIDDLKRQLSDLTQQLKTKDNEAAKMQDKLSAAEQKMADQTERLEALQKSLEETAMLNRAAVVESSTKAVLAKSLEEVQEQNRQLLNETDELKGQLETARQELTRVHHQWTAEQKVSAAVVAELTSARAEVTAYQNQLQAVTDQNDQRGVSDAVHYKERAKLQADLSAWKRRVELLEKEKMELEATIEDVTLDKEQMQEEKEILEDKYEEIKLDAETAQMEVEELRMELEDAKAAVERVTGLDTDAARTTTVAAVPSLGSEQHGEDAAAFDMVQALQVQNLRLRDALIRLREQSALEKMELTRQLRSTEKDAEANTAVQKRVEELTDSKQNYEEQINDLKDMVEQGAAFESMVEDLSDRVMALEEVNVALQMVVRELEEASELTAEMEEVQADELKAMAIDLEGRDTIIRNMEEAIKMYAETLPKENHKVCLLF